jgi:hypothetical protein
VQVTGARIVCSCVNGGLRKSFTIYQLTVTARLLYVAKEPHFVVGSTMGKGNLFRPLWMLGEYRRKNLALFCWWRETLSSDPRVIGVRAAAPPH